MADSLESWGEFPRIGLIVNGKKKFYSLQDAIPVWDSGWLDVRDSKEVLEADFSVRLMTDEENKDFQERVDQFSASK